MLPNLNDYKLSSEQRNHVARYSNLVSQVERECRCEHEVSPFGRVLAAITFGKFAQMLAVKHRTPTAEKTAYERSRVGYELETNLWIADSDKNAETIINLFKRDAEEFSSKSQVVAPKALDIVASKLNTNTEANADKGGRKEKTDQKDQKK